MRRFGRVVAVFAAGALGILAAGGPAAAAGRSPRLVCDETTYDFGAVERGAVVRHVFRLHNAGDAALRIRRVSAPCGCTVARVSRTLVPPGESSLVEVSFDTARFRGWKAKSFLLSTNDPVRPVEHLTVRGEVTAEIVADPPVLYLGRIPPGVGATGEIRVLGSQGQPIEIGAVVADNPAVHLAVESVPAAGAAGRRVVVGIDPGMPHGPFSDTVRISATGTHRVSLAVPLLGTVEGDLTVRPSHVTIRRRPAGRRRRQRLTVRNRGRIPIAIAGVRVPELALDYAVRTVRAGYEYQITLRPRGSLARGGRHRGTVHIYTTHPRERELVVPVYAVAGSGAG